MRPTQEMNTIQNTSSRLSKGKGRKEREGPKPDEPAKSLPLPIIEPIISPDPLTCNAEFNGIVGKALVDSGSQVDVISTKFAAQLGIELHHLIAPLHADLGAEGHTVRLALFADSISFSSGAVTFPTRSFFVSSLPAGLDAILGTPFMRDSGTSVSADSVFFTPKGPSQPVINMSSNSYSPQP